MRNPVLHPVPMRRVFPLPLVLLAALSLSGCELIGDIFKVGVWVGVIIVLLVILAIWAIVRMIR